MQFLLLPCVSQDLVRLGLVCALCLAIHDVILHPNYRHGPITPCKIVAIEQFLEAYMAAEPDSPERLRLERLHGKRQIQKLVAEHEEAKANRAWLEKNTMACPGCRTNVEKTMGCNHVWISISLFVKSRF